VDGATRDAIAAAVRAQARTLVVAGEGAHRAAAIEVARADASDVLEVRPPDDAGEPWAGLATVLAACRAHAPHVAPPAALEAASTGRAVGDHLGLAADLCNHLARVAEERTWTLLVHDAHRFDLSSAAVLGLALADGPGGIRAVVTQDRTARGVSGLAVHVVGGGSTSEQVATSVSEPGAVEATARRAKEAAHVGAVLDAAAAAEAVGDWPAAAAWWLEGGRSKRCERALASAGPVPAAAAVAARLAMRTTSDRRRREISDRALSLLDGCDPVGAARVRVLDASVRVVQGDPEGAAAALDRAARALAATGASPAGRVAEELHDVVAGMLSLVTGGDASGVLRSVERPLARLGAGGIDGDAVQVLATAAVPLGWYHHLDEARSLLDRVISVLDARRHFVMLAHPLATSAWLARRRGRLELALTHGSRAIDLARACGWTSDERRATVEVAHVEALQGRLDDCRDHVAALVPPGELPHGAAQLGAVSALAVAELLADEPGRVVELLEPVQERFADSVSPSHTAWRHNLVEAYVRTGRTSDAEAVLCDLVRWADRTGSLRERGLVSWCRGMLAPAGAYDLPFAEARDQLAAYPTLRWRAGLHHLRRLLADARPEGASLADRLVVDAGTAGLVAGAEHVRNLQRHHGVEVAAAPSVAALSVDDLRVALALAEGADPEEVAAQLRLTPRRVEEVRARVLDLLGLDDAEHLAGFLHLERSTPTRSAALVRILGPTVVQRGEQQLVPPAGRPAALLALLATEGGAAPVERVLDVLWPDVGADRARGRLRNVLARLRAAVGGVVERDGERLVLAPAVEVDAHRFDRLADDALRAAAPDELVARSELALGAWGGDPLPAWPYDDWALRERQRLVQRCVTLHVRRAEALASAGEVGAALDELEQAVLLQPDARDLWERAVVLAEADERVGRARSLRRRAADLDIELI
jgi:DNA-binding SARP family transcriptional activator